MNKEQLDKEMKRFIKELAVSATLTCNLYQRAKELSKEIEKNG
jgi:hypothetical protein